MAVSLLRSFVLKTGVLVTVAVLAVWCVSAQRSHKGALQVPITRWTPLQDQQKTPTKMWPVSDSSYSNTTAEEDYVQRSANYWLNNGIHVKIMKDENYIPLTPTQVEQVEKLVFFTGYPRSGHSIFGAFMDAHPNIALSYSFMLFRHLMRKDNEKANLVGLLENKTLFFNTMFERSYRYSTFAKKQDFKGYTLDVPGTWSGKFDRKLKVIGDKSAMPTTTRYANMSHVEFKKQYERLQESVKIPVVGIHVVRNPFDMIATHTLYKGLGPSWKDNSRIMYANNSLLTQMVGFYFSKARAVQEMVPLCGMNILEVHSEDVVKDARRQLLHMCEFLQVDCLESYLQACESKVYKSVSRTRDLVYWPPEIRAQVEQNIEKYSFFRGYTFEEDYYNPT